MASSKRRADSDDEDADSDSQLQSSSPSQTSSNKRPRLRLHSSDSQDESEVESASTLPAEYELLNDNGNEEISDDDEEVEAQTQALRSQRAENHDKGNIAREAGVLESVELHNFMCHHFIIYKLGPLINFICGKNGSGKSAILTAIILCLGGKASTTNRGGSLKTFIKEGEEQSRIICKLKNGGENAFLPEDYGHTIEIERYFSRTGGGGYKIKNEKGRIITTKKADLEEICDHFALQIDNPLIVLSQDMARQFIASSNPTEKYKLFMKGIYLEQLDRDYQLLGEQLTNVQTKIRAMEEDLKMLKQNKDKAEHKDKMVKKKDGIKQKLKDLRRQLAWVQVRDQEDLRDEFIREIADADTKIGEAEAEVNKFDERYQNVDRLSIEMGEAHTQARSEANQAEEDKREFQARFNDVKSDVTNAQTELRTVKEQLTSHKKTMQARSKEIEVEEDRLRELDGGGAATRLRGLEEAKHLAEEAKVNWSTHQISRDQVLKNAKEMEDKLRNAAEDVETKTQEFKSSEKKLDDLIRNKGRQDEAFRPNMPQLLQAISRESRWQQKPIGPIGKHVQLLRPEWSSILEKSFGATLDGFIVICKRDSDLLNDLIRRTNCDATVFISNTTPIDTRPHEPDHDFDTILRVLGIDNELVRKQLVISHNIEQTILISDLREATRTMFDGARLRNVKLCLAVNPNNKRLGFALKYNRSNDPGQESIKEFKGSPRMKTDIEARIALQRQAVAEAKEQLHISEQKFYAARNEHENAKKAVVRHKRRDEELKIASQAADDEIVRLEEAIKEDNVEGGRLDVLRKALGEAEEAKGMTEELYQDAVISFDEKKQKLRASQQEMEDINTRVDRLRQIADAAMTQAQEADKNRAFHLREKNNASARVDDARADRELMNNKLQEKEVRLADFITQARNISDRVNLPDGATQQGLSDKYTRLRDDLNNYHRQLGGTEQEIADAAKTASDAYTRAKLDLDNLQALNIQLVTSLEQRRERWQKFRHFISVRAKATFTLLLSERSFRGSLIADHVHKRLEISIEPDITKKNGAGRGAKTLSGGEKSFSQICLLLSIWEAMGSPLRCLDEFDVYMDAVNRSMSVNMLIQAARESVGRQFLLISPGTKNDIKKAPDVHVTEIAAPERGQQTLVY